MMSYPIVYIARHVANASKPSTIRIIIKIGLSTQQSVQF